MNIDGLNLQELKAYQAHLRDYLRDLNRTTMVATGRLSMVAQRIQGGGVSENPTPAPQEQKGGVDENKNADT